ncbi:MAG: type III pantothenate kinase [Verrucomicrobia bacterium]|nr:type III pantothenate kinase [Verrucomicrobiota bacterium]
MRWLLVDNSNTRTKFAVGEPCGLGEWRGVLATADLSIATLAALLGGMVFEAAVIASVVPHKARVLREYLEPRVPVHLLDFRSPLGMGIDYPEPGQIGADRLANAVGVLARHGVPAVVIDLGTAVTFDIVSAAPAYCGGVIAPGLGAMTRYLAQATALLPEIVLEEPASAIGKSTIHAMQVGAVLGYRGLVREILARICAELGGRPKIIATGGDAELITHGIPEIDAVDPDLTLAGIRQVALAVFPP